MADRFYSLHMLVAHAATDRPWPLLDILLKLQDEENQ